MRKEMVVTYGLMGIEPPRASMIPPTNEKTANIVLRSGTTTGDDESRRAAAAGVTSIDRTKSEPTICTETATAKPRSSMKYSERKRVGTPRAAATSASTL